MSYIDVYFSRINHLGETTAERIRSGGIRSFFKWMAESPHTVRDLSVERGIYFDGIILTNKDKEYEKILFLNVANDTPIVIGDIMNWTVDDGSIEKWIIVQEEKKVNGTYRTFWIVRCNYLMRWVDGEGHVQESWSYFVSSLDSKIKGNFRTWNNLITPQPNKYAELLMPRFPINRATNFIVEEESWTVVEYDHTSVPGIIYLSLTEGKINSIYDEVEDNLADLDKITNYSLSIPDKQQRFNPGEEIKPYFTLIKNGIPFSAPVNYISTDTSLVKVVDGKLIAQNKTGNVDIIIQLADNPSIQQILNIEIGNEPQEFSVYIEGKEIIRLDSLNQYQLKTTDENYDDFNIFKLYHIIVVDLKDKINYDTNEYLFFNHPRFGDKYLAIHKNENWELEETSTDSATANNFAAQYDFETDLGTIVKKNNDWFIQTNQKNKLGYMILGNIYKHNNKFNFAFKIVEVIPLW